MSSDGSPSWDGNGSGFNGDPSRPSLRDKFANVLIGYGSGMNVFYTNPNRVWRRIWVLIVVNLPGPPRMSRMFSLYILY